MYKCIRCGYEVRTKSRFKKHLERKTLCDANLKDINKDELLNNYIDLYPELCDIINQDNLNKKVKFKIKSKSKEKKPVQLINFGDEIFENILSEDDIIYILNSKKEWIQTFVRKTYCNKQYPEINNIKIDSETSKTLRYYSHSFVRGDKNKVIETIIKNTLDFLDRMSKIYKKYIDKKTYQLLIERINSDREEAGIEQDYSWCFGLKDEIIKLIYDHTF